MLASVIEAVVCPRHRGRQGDADIPKQISAPRRELRQLAHLRLSADDRSMTRSVVTNPRPFQNRILSAFSVDTFQPLPADFCDT